MSPGAFVKTQRQKSGPRASGDEPLDSVPSRTQTEWSPRERG